jgi:hypothetical protein
MSFTAMDKFFGCPREFAFNYIDKIEVPDDNEWFKKGRALHSCAEHGNLDAANALEDPVMRTQVRCGAMKYLDAQKMGVIPKFTKKEVKIINEEEQFYGRMDSENINDDGTWLIGETKTTSSFDQVRFALMRCSHQIGLYIGMIKPYAAQNFLYANDFLGVHNVTVAFPGRLEPYKANKRRKTDESLTDFEKRVFEKTGVYQQMLTRKEVAVDSAMAAFQWFKEQVDHLGPQADNYPKCTAHCKNNFGLCSYFKYCHGFDISLGADVESDIDAEDMPS